MKHSEQLNELAAAMAKAQGAMENAKKDTANPFFKSKYADLSSVWAAIRKPLSENGLSVVQLPSTDEAGRVSVSTMLLHSSGQYIEASYALPATKPDAQGFGSAITYMKRYALTGMGVAPEDDDGNAASQPQKEDHSTPPQGVARLPSPDHKAQALQWGKTMEAKVPTMMLPEFREWDADPLTKQRIAKIRDYNEAMHGRLSALVLKRQLELSTQLKGAPNGH